MYLNSNPYPVTLNIPQNILLGRSTLSIGTIQNRSINPILAENLEKYNIDFFEGISK